MSKSEERAPVVLRGDEPTRETDEAPVDLSALDPSRDAARWASMVNQVAQRARALRRARAAPTVISIALAWARPVLVAAGVLIAATWAIAGVRTRQLAEAPLVPAAITPASTPPAFAVAAWASADETPETTAILTALGDEP